MAIKVKTAKPPMDKIPGIHVELIKLGFRGGKIKISRSKNEFYYDRRVWCDLKGDRSGDSVQRRRSMVEFSIEITQDIKLNSYVWKYGSDKESSLSERLGLHGKLVLILGSN